MNNLTDTKSEHFTEAQLKQIDALISKRCDALQKKQDALIGSIDFTFWLLSSILIACGLTYVVCTLAFNTEFPVGETQESVPISYEIDSPVQNF